MQKEYEVSCGENRIYVVDYMSGPLGFSSRQAKKLLKYKKVRINGKTAYRDNRLRSGDLLEIDMSEEPREEVEAEDIKLSIIYEDEYILAVNKPPYMLVHPTPNHPSGTLLNAVANHFRKQGKEAALRLLNRLDMNTSGIVVIPKSAAVHRTLDERMKDGSIKKYYIAIIQGVIKPEKGIIDEPIGKNEEDPIRRTVASEGQPAVTVYETLSKSKGCSMVRLELLTGRTHQIRVHLSHLGCPIIGDTLYGKESPLIGRQALHASDMELPHPVGNGTIKLHAELPPDIIELAAELELE
ncbi:MAG: RluA family pseudouridine synthase [Clostridia bacterium]